MTASVIITTVLASAAMGSIVTWVGTMYVRAQDERRKGVTLARQAALLTAALSNMLYVVEEKSATEFDARRLPELMALLKSPEFLAFVSADEIIGAYAALSDLETKHLQFERVYPRFIDLHVQSLTARISPTDLLELEHMESGLRRFARDGRRVLQEDVTPTLARITHRLEARAFPKLMGGLA